MTIPPEPTRTSGPPVLSFEERIRALTKASPEELVLCDRILSGHPTKDGSLRLLTFAAAAKEINCGRSTIERLVEEGSLPTVVLRRGRRRIREADLKALIMP